MCKPKENLLTWTSVIPFDELSHPSGFLSVLNFTRPFQFHQIPSGVDRYGQPVTEGDFTIEIGDQRLPTFTIQFPLDDDETWRDVESVIDEVNKGYVAKILTHKHKVIFNIDTIFLGLVSDQ